MSILSMEQRIEELRKKRQKIHEGGGPDKLEKHRASGRLTARERIEALVDPGSFMETGAFAQHRATLFGMAGREVPADGVVTGSA
ncbi:MAG: carboxyl transferase domain-containing protein, partial [Bryobacteraceae bacterium]